MWPFKKKQKPDESVGIQGIYSCPNDCEVRGMIVWVGDKNSKPVCDRCGATLVQVVSQADLENFADRNK